MNANHYLHRYGATREMLGWIALNGRANAARNPVGDLPRTDDDGRLPVGASRSRARSASTTATCPATLRSPSIVSDASVAADLPKPAIRIEAVGTQITERVSWDQDTITHEPQVLGQSAHLWTRTTMRPERRRPRARVRRVHLQRDLVARSARLLRARRSEGLARRGRRIALDGDLPVNPHGGQLSEGRTHGFGFLYEAMAQLRHEAGERQVRDAGTAVVTSGGGTPSGVLLLQRDG